MNQPITSQAVTEQLNPQVRQRSRERRWNRRDTLAGYFFILPSIIGFSVFVVYPLLSTIYLALTKWDGLSAPIFIGVENFRYMFVQDPAFWPSMKATIVYILILVPTSLAVGIGLALLLNRKLLGIRLFRTIFYLPAILPLVATITLWKYIFNVKFGLANALLMALHAPTSMWLGGESTALPTMALISVWSVGTTMVIFLAALQTVPKEIYEAARIDGASALQLFTEVTVPSISPIIFLQLINLIIASLQEFNKPKILTEGGPNYATNLLMYNIYNRGFGNLSQNPDLGYASAQVIVLFLLILAVTVFTFRFSNSWVYAGNALD